jgi:hypothetical protein
MANRLWHWADVAWYIFPPAGLVLDFCALVAEALHTLAYDERRFGRE